MSIDRVALEQRLLALWQQTAVVELRRYLPKEGGRLGIVGGAVRDSALGLPVTDIDLVWQGPFAILAEALHASPFKVRIREHYLTAGLRHRGLALDLAATRRDHYPTPGGLAEVTPANLDADLARRDFTINAVAAFPSDNGIELIDPFAGLDDLAARRLSAIRAETLAEDPVRLLRGARYLVRLALNMGNHWQPALGRARTPSFWAGVAPGRLWLEHQQIADEPTAPEIYQWLADADLLRPLWGSASADRVHAANWRRRHAMERSGSGRNWLLDLAAIQLAGGDASAVIGTTWQHRSGDWQRWQKSWRKLAHVQPPHWLCKAREPKS